MAETTKDIKLDDGTTSVELGGAQVKEDAKNEIDSFAKPDTSGGSPEHRALNLNRIKRQYEVTVTIGDDGAIIGTNPDTYDKEDVKADFKTIFESTNQVTLTYGSETISGYVTQYTITEKADEANSIYDVKFAFLEAVPMNS